MVDILVADDSVSMRQMVVVTLQDAGYNAFEAADGEEALKLAKEHNIQVVISDVNMPIMDGIMLIKELRQLPEYKYTPILMLTTESSEEKKAEGKSAGATGWLTKPFNPEKLLDTLNKVIDYD